MEEVRSEGGGQQIFMHKTKALVLAPPIEKSECEGFSSW